jgi:hypothetical protein
VILWFVEDARSIAELVNLAKVLARIVGHASWHDDFGAALGEGFFVRANGLIGRCGKGFR